MVQPLTVTVAELEAPGPPVLLELETEPPPACTCTDEPPADELLDTLLALEPPVDDEAPAAVMLPSACRSTVTLQLCPSAVRPAFVIVAASVVTAQPPMAIEANRTLSK